MAPPALVPVSLSSGAISLRVSAPGSIGFLVSPKRLGSDATGSQINGYFPSRNRKISEGLEWATWLVHTDLHCVPSRYKRAASLIARASGQGPALSDQNGSSGSARGGGEDNRGVLKALALFKGPAKSGPPQAGIETEVYTLKWRELVAMVAKQEGVSIAVLRQLNPGVDLDNVRSKQQIVIPKRKDVETATLCPPPPRIDAPPPPIPPPAAPPAEMQHTICPPAAPPSESSIPDRASDKGREEGGLGSALANVVRKLKGVNPGEGPPSETVETASYRFIRGDRLSDLAVEWSMTEEDIMLLNPSLSSESIKTGTTITVPKESLYGGKLEQGGDGRGGRVEADGSRSFMIQPHDTLLTVARRCGVSVDEIVEANGLVEYQRIRVGQVLTIPKQKEEMRLTTAQLAGSGLPGYLGVPTRTLQILTVASLLVAFAAGGWLIARSETRKWKGRRLANVPLPAVSEQGRGGQDLAAYLKLPPGSGRGLGQVAGTSGWGRGVTLEVAFDQALEGAAEVSGSGNANLIIANADLIIANAGICLQSESDRGLPQALGFLGDKVRGGGQLLGVAAGGGEGREGTGGLFSASVLLLQTPGGKAEVSSVAVGEEEEVEAAVKRAAEGLGRASRVSPEGLKSIVACVCLDHEPAVQRELALLFPNLSIYTVTSNKATQRPDWFVSEDGGEVPQALPSRGLSLLGVPVEAAYQGANLACVIGQWLYGSHLRLCAHAPVRNVGDE